MKKLLIILILLCLCLVAKAATWDIGAVQSENSATDIGAVQAAASTSIPVFMYHYMNH